MFDPCFKTYTSKICDAIAMRDLYLKQPLFPSPDILVRNKAVQTDMSIQVDDAKPFHQPANVFKLKREPHKISKRNGGEPEAADKSEEAEASQNEEPAASSY